MTTTMERAPAMDQAKMADILEKLKDSPIVKGTPPAELTDASKSTPEPSANPASAGEDSRGTNAAETEGFVRPIVNSVAYKHNIAGSSYVDPSCYIYHYQTDTWVHYSDTEYYAGFQGGYYYYTFIWVNRNSLHSSLNNPNALITDVTIRHPVNTPCSYVIWSYSGFKRVYEGITQYNAATGTYEIVVPFMKVLAAGANTYCIEVLNSSFATIDPNLNIDVNYEITQGFDYENIFYWGEGDTPYDETKHHDLHKYDIYYPASGYLVRPLPAILTIHGGFWSNFPNHLGYDKAYFEEYTDRIKALGCVQINVDYRLINSTDPDKSASGMVTLDRMLDDIETVIRDVKANYGAYIDTSKLAIMGFSAGGHLSLMYACTRGNQNDSTLIPITHVISEAGPTNLYPLWQYWHDTPPDLHAVGGPTFTSAQIDNIFSSLVGFQSSPANTNWSKKLTDISPASFGNYLRTNYKTLLVYSSGDDVVIQDQGNTLKIAINDSNRCVWETLSDALDIDADIDHHELYDRYDDSPNYQAAWRAFISDYKASN